MDYPGMKMGQKVTGAGLRAVFSGHNRSVWLE